MVAQIGMAGAELLIQTALPKPLKLLTTAVNTVRFGKRIKRIAYNIQNNPATYAAGFLTELMVGNHPLVQLAAQIALISRSTFELHDAHTALVRSWNDFGSLKNHVPIEIIKHACQENSKKSTTRTLVKALPNPCAKVVVKMQDVSHLVANLSKAILNYLDAWDTLYCACHLDTLNRFAVNAEIYINIHQCYKRISENTPELIDLLHTIPDSVNGLLKLAKIPLTTDTLVAKLTKDSASTVRPTATNKAGLGEKIMSFLDRIVFTITHITINYPVKILPNSDPKNYPKQPTLQPRANNGYNSNSYTTRQASSRNRSRRFYKTSE